MAASEQITYIFLLCFSALFAAMAFLFESPQEIWEGSLIILVSPANLITDYFALANVGSALLNASLMSLLSIATLALARVPITGVMMASVFTVAGFSLFGKNLYNSLPIILGVLCYCKAARVPFRDNLLPAFFGTALAPLVSEITFHLGLPLPLGIPLGILAGILAGLLLPPLSRHFLSFHQGYNLYNIGFTAGIIGTFFIALLRTFHIKIEAVSLLSGGNNFQFGILLYGLFAAMLLLGLGYNGWSWRGYNSLLLQSGKLTPDFLALSGFGLTVINMALLGLIATTYVLLIGGELTGPSIGGILTVAGFGACGKHVKNVMPVLFGIFLMGVFNAYDICGAPALLAALFGTTLAPLSGYYGPFAGMIAGVLHMALVTNIGDLHAGMNLYNNGFSGGLIAAVLVPIFDSLLIQKKSRQLEADPG